MKHVTAVLLFITLLAAFGGTFIRMSDSSPFLASAFFKDSVTASSLKLTYAEAGKKMVQGNRRKEGEKVRVLIVPGHDAQFSGTTFNGLQELDLNLELGQKLYNLLKTEPAFDVRLSQTKNGYDPDFLKYFEDNRTEILEFIGEHKGQMDYFVSTGQVERVVYVEHNSAPSEVAMKLFGINKWANENGTDIVIHIHFNDYPGRKKYAEPKYSGFAIYVPENQYSNAKGSRSVAEFIHERLEKLYPQSNLPIEDAGVVEDQELIAIGSHNTLDGAGMLIEYGYIYETAFHEPTLRDTVTSDLALQTFLGIMDFFGETTDVGGKYGTEFVPHEWQDDLKNGADSDPDVLKLQAALVLEGMYPPPGKAKNDCALTGHFGPCTEKAVVAFQKKYEIFPAEGFVGEKTRAKLNEIFGK